MSGKQPDSYDDGASGSARRGRKAVIGVVGIGVVALLGVGTYVGFGGDDDAGGRGSAGAETADGPHKLIAPKTVLEKYEQVDGITSAAMEDPARFGVRGAKTVQAVYGSGRGAKAISAGLIQYTGAYGTVAAPKRTVNALFADLADRARKPRKGGEKSTMVGRPEDFSADGVVVKCQETRTEGRSSAAPESRQVLRAPLCAWADRSTAAVVMPMDTRATKAGKAVSLADAAATTKRLREEVRVAR